MELISKLYNHVVQAIDVPVGGGEGDQLLHQVYWRSKGCQLGCEHFSKLSNDLIKILGLDGVAKITPFMTLVWQKQWKLF